MTIDDLAKAARKPEPYEVGAELWNDPHISQGMLAAHLEPETDAASYRPERIDAICENIIRIAGLKDGDSVVDLGCGPGLYCARLAAKGLRMTGIDRSERSIEYARAQNTPGADYMLGSYLDPFGKGLYDAALLIWQDYGVLNPKDRLKLLRNVHRALKPGGCLLMDVAGAAAFQQRLENSAARWYASDAGFWRPNRHFVMEDLVPYPEIPALCDRYVVEDPSGVAIYRVWQTYFTPDTLRPELAKCDFWAETLMAGLDGGEYAETSPEIGVLCRRI